MQPGRANTLSAAYTTNSASLPASSKTPSTERDDAVEDENRESSQQVQLCKFKRRLNHLLVRGRVEDALSFFEAHKSLADFGA